MGDPAQLGDGGGELVDRLVEHRVHVHGPGVPLGEPQRHPERDEPLLRAVVQVAFQPAALGVARLQQARPARLDLVQRLAELAAQPHDLDQQPGRRPDLREQPGRGRSAQRADLRTAPRTGTAPGPGSTATPAASTSPLRPGRR